MRVGKTGGAKGAEARGAVRRGGGGDFKLDNGPPSTAPVASPAAPGLDGVSTLGDPLIALNERRQAIAAGQASLECLDQLRLDILDGRVSQETAAKLAALVKQRSNFAIDNDLRETVEEIGFRLRFEAARLAAGRRKRE